MDSAVINDDIKTYLTEIYSRPSEAAQIAKAAEACASAGSVTEAVAVSMDIEAGRLHDSAKLLNRLSQA